MLRLTDEQCSVIRKHFSEESYPDDRPGRKPEPACEVLDAVLWILNTGKLWHILPESYPNSKAVHRRFRQWREIDYRQPPVGVGRQVDPRDRGLLVDDVIDEAQILVWKAVVVLVPDVRGQQVGQRGDLAPPGQLRGDFQPLGVLVEHRIQDVDKRFVTVEETVWSGVRIGASKQAGSCGSHLCRALVQGSQPSRGVL